MSGFLNGRIEYRSFLGEDEEFNAKYASFTLDDILVREIFAVDVEMEKNAGVTVYYFPGRSSCRNESGEICTMPRPKYGDLCVLRVGEEDESIVRVAEVGYYTGSGSVGHIRLKLK